MEILRSLTFLALICLVDATADITHSRLDDSHVITTEGCNYAITNRPILNRILWKTVSVNKDSVVIITPSCQVIKKSMLTMSKHEKDILAAARSEIERVNTAMNSADYATSKVSSSRFSPNGGEVCPSRARNVDVTTYQSEGLSIQMFDEENYSLSKTNMPNELARIFVNKDVVTYTYRDGRIDMKPQTCLDNREKLAFKEYKEAVLRADKKHREAMEKMKEDSKTRMKEAQVEMKDMQKYMRDMQIAMHKQMAQNLEFMDEPHEFNYPELNDEHLNQSAEPIHLAKPEAQATSRPIYPWQRTTIKPAAASSSRYNRSPPPNPFASTRKPFAPLPTRKPYLLSTLYATNTPRPTYSVRPANNPYAPSNRQTSQAPTNPPGPYYQDHNPYRDQ